VCPANHAEKKTTENILGGTGTVKTLSHGNDKVLGSKRRGGLQERKDDGNVTTYECRRN